MVQHLGQFQIATNVRRVLTGKDRSKIYRGGLLSYQKAKLDIMLWLKEDRKPEARFTTMFDLYALPSDFPGYRKAQEIKDPYEKVVFLERAMAEDIGDRRFIPYLQLHEFEALILANPQNLEVEYFFYSKAIAALVKLVKNHDNNPELIDEGKETAPSKRIRKLIPEYDKVSVGAVLAGIQGIDWLKKKCPHFGDWIHRLETLGSSPGKP